MASSEQHEFDALQENGDDDLLCTIEASVVTGFEESARGEAKEKFNTDVTAARGKVIWRVPLSKVKNVLKMGSVDNCKVVIHTVPCFKFTDQHDSLADLQRMVKDIDWQFGLKAWQRVYHFPHPIEAHPQGVVSADDLVDVVISKQPAPKDKSTKKSKNKKPWGKKKERKKTEAGQNRNKMESSKSAPGRETVEIEDAVESMSGLGESSKAAVSEIGDGRAQTGSDGLTAQQKTGLDEITAGRDQTVRTEGLPSLDPGADLGGHHDDSCAQLSQCLHSVKLQVDQADSSPSIESPALGTCSHASESEFASNVIRRLTSPSQPIPRNGNFGANSPHMMCVTPPPTPIRSIDNPFSSLHGKLPLGSASNLRSQNAHQDYTTTCESGVDPRLATFCDQVKPPVVISSSNATSSTFSAVPLPPTQPSSADAGGTPIRELSSGQSGSPGQPGESSHTTDVPAKKVRDPTRPTFRVTCNRTGDNHAFDSSSAAASLGSAIITYLGWQVDLKNFDIEVILNIDNEEVTVSLGLTKMSLHYRNLVAFGPTTLRATICYNMLRLCHIKNGDFVCDPMCGTSAIPIEGARSWTNCYHFGGDCHEKAIAKSILNVAAIQQQMIVSNKSSLKLDTVQWDVQRLPLRDKCVDVFVSDLPFGHRIGSRSDNLALYSGLLSEMARTARAGARACLLTEDKFSLTKAIQTLGKYWQRRLILNINIGGLTGFVFVLTRTTSAAIQLWAGSQDGVGQPVVGGSQDGVGQPDVGGSQDGVGQPVVGGLQDGVGQPVVGGSQDGVGQPVVADKSSAQHREGNNTE